MAATANCQIFPKEFSGKGEGILSRKFTTWEITIDGLPLTYALLFAFMLDLHMRAVRASTRVGAASSTHKPSEALAFSLAKLHASNTNLFFTIFSLVITLDGMMNYMSLGGKIVAKFRQGGNVFDNTV